MSDITLHFRVDGSPLCAVCSANIDRPASRWWLENTWTRHRSHYEASETSKPGEYSRPCGSLRRLGNLKTPNVIANRPGKARDEL
jgi:hypothetical protein